MSEDTEVAILAGSDSDLPSLGGGVDVLDELEIGYELRIMSAHRTPDRVSAFAREAESRGLKVIIAAAGGAAHLAGVVAAHTNLPVVGVPISTDRMGGMDSLLSTVQMPGGVPVASMGLGSSGGKNAAVFAARILALQDAELSRRLERYVEDMAGQVEEKNERARRWLDRRRQERQQA